jgi:hypothetical protein
MMKTRLETLEDLYNVAYEDLVRAEVKIKNLDDLEDDDPIPGFKKKGLYGDYTEASKKDVIEQEQVEIKRLLKVIGTIEKLIDQVKDDKIKTRK